MCPLSGGPDRCHQIARVLRLAFRMAQGNVRWNVYGDTDADHKRFHRDLMALEKAGIPVTQEGTSYGIDRKFMQRFM